jgi:hypothetical protein
MEDLIKDVLCRTISENGGRSLYRRPLVGFARADDPLFGELKRVVGTGHQLPADILPGAQSVAAFFIPFSKELVEVNKKHTYVAREWAEAYIETNRLISLCCERFMWCRPKVPRPQMRHRAVRGKGIVMILLWMSWFGMCPLDPLQLALPGILRQIGLGLLIVGLVLALGALAQLRGVENIDYLVTTGLFSKIRHPMYTGFMLWILGWAVYHNAMISQWPGSLVSATSFTGGGWRKRNWNHVMEKPIGNIAGEHGFDPSSNIYPSCSRKMLTEFLHTHPSR